MDLKQGLFTRVARGVGALDGWIQARSGPHQRRNRWAVNLLDVRDGMRVLELGCGPGLRLDYVRAQSPHATLVGLDESEPLLAAARKRLPANVFDARRGGLAELAVEKSAFDRVLCVDGPRTWADVDDALALLVAAMRPHAQLLLCFDYEEAEEEELQARFTAAYARGGLAAARIRRFYDHGAASMAVLGLKL